MRRRRRLAEVGHLTARGVGIAGGGVGAGQRHRIAGLLQPRLGAAGDVEHQFALDESCRIVDSAGVIPAVTRIEHDPCARMRAVQASSGQQREQPAQHHERPDGQDTGQRENNRPRAITETPHHRAPSSGADDDPRSLFATSLRHARVLMTDLLGAFDERRGFPGVSMDGSAPEPHGTCRNQHKVLAGDDSPSRLLISAVTLASAPAPIPLKVCSRRTIGQGRERPQSRRVYDIPRRHGAQRVTQPCPLRRFRGISR